MKLVPVTALTLAVAVCVALASPGSVPEDLPWRVSPVQTPAGPGSAQPQFSVVGEQAMLSWIERAGARATLKFAERTASGWTEARTVASGDNWFVNWADVPSVTRLADKSLAAHWLQKSGPETYAYDVRLAFSKDEGRTWTPSVTPHHDGTKTEHGFASLFQAPRGGLGLVWLDGRAMKPGHHGGPGGGAMSLRAATFDASGTQLTETLVDDRVCECCPTAVAVTAEGPIAAFRNRSDQEVRDIYVSRLVDGKWTAGTPVHHDNWRIPACPVNGPSLSARGRRVAIAWFTMVDNKGRAFLAYSDDAGATFGKPIAVDDAGTLGRVDVDLLADGSAAVAWIETAGNRSELRLRRVGRGGERDAAVTVAELGAGRSSGYPRLARRGSELLLAWTETGQTPRVRTATVAIR